MVSMVRYQIDRDSVCMGDDVFDHRIEVELSDDATYQDLFHALKKIHYLPSSSRCVWVMANPKHFCICSYFKEIDHFSLGLIENRLSVLDDGSHLFRMKYYSPEGWKERILSEYDNDTYSLWKDGWNKELELCDRLIR